MRVARRPLIGQQLHFVPITTMNHTQPQLSPLVEGVPRSHADADAVLAVWQRAQTYSCVRAEVDAIGLREAHAHDQQFRHVRFDGHGCLNADGLLPAEIDRAYEVSVLRESLGAELFAGGNERLTSCRRLVPGGARHHAVVGTWTPVADALAERRSADVLRLKPESKVGLVIQAALEIPCSSDGKQDHDEEDERESREPAYLLTQRRRPDQGAKHDAACLHGFIGGREWMNHPARHVRKACHKREYRACPASTG